MSGARVYDARPCQLGEGVFWHPVRNQLFWFDILGQSLLSLEKGEERLWRFPELVSAAGWVERDILLIAGERDLFLLDIETEEMQALVELESGNRATRSNDGRADPQGGFWISTMGKAAETGAGAIYRYAEGELRKLYGGLTIPNAITFTPDGRTAQFADTRAHKVMRVALDAAGWPVGEPSTFLDLSAEGLNPDGATMDAEGLTWIAEWGAARVAAYGPDGRRVRTVAIDAPHTSCPAFGPDGTLYCTTARQGLDSAALAASPLSGQTFAVAGVARGRAEHQVRL